MTTTNDDAALREVMKDYFDGLYHSDTERLGRVFHPRNPELQPGSRYETERPPLTEVSPGHFAALFPEDVPSLS